MNALSRLLVRPQPFKQLNTSCRRSFHPEGPRTLDPPSAHAGYRTVYRWIATGILTPLAVAYVCERIVNPDKPVGSSLGLDITDISAGILNNTPAQALAQDTAGASTASAGAHMFAGTVKEDTDDLMAGSGPLVEETLKGGIAASVLNEQAKMWTCLWGWVGEAPCSFPVI